MTHDSPPSLPWKRADTLLAALQALLIAVVYARALRFDFVFDDFPLILQNPLVLAPLKSIPRFFTEGYFDRIFPQAPANDYRPLLSFWLLLNQRLWGFNPAGWHIAPILLHVVVTFGVYLLGRRLLRERASAALAAVIFALHPVHVETTAWVIGMNEPLMAVPFVAAFIAFLRFREASRRPKVWLAVSLACYALALSAKEDAIVLPALIAAWAWLFEARGQSEKPRRMSGRLQSALAACAPYLVLTAIYLVVRLEVLGGFSHTASLVPFMTMVWTAPLALWHHLRLLVWPVGLSVFYDVPYVKSPFSTEFLLPAAALAAFVALLWTWGRRRREVDFLAVWIFVPLIPLLDLRILPEGEFVHDRYVFLSSIAFALLLAAAVHQGAERMGRPLNAVRVKIAAAAALALILGALSFHDTAFWANNLTLFIRAATVAPDNNAAVDNLANEFVKRGRHEEAVPLYQKVIGRDPKFWLANYNLGVCEYKMGRYKAALGDLDRAAALVPSEADIFVYEGLSLYRLGRFAEAESAMRRAVELRPDGSGYHLALGMILKARGAPDQALAEFRRELAYHPEEAAARQEIANLEAEGSGQAPQSSPKP